MRHSLILLALAASLSAAPTVSNIRYDGLGDSSVRLIFDVSTSFDSLRFRYGLVSTSGGIGTIQQVGTAPSTFRLYGMTGDVSGLSPSTLWYVSPEVSSDGGMTWSTGVETSFTTTARNNTVQPPVPVDVDFPVPTGTQLNVLANCSNFQAQLNAAVPGDTIVVPKASLCTGQYTLPTNPAALTFLPADVRTSDSRITVTHAFSENQSVRVSSGQPNGAFLPGNRLYPRDYANTDKSGGWHKGGRYNVHVIDGTHVQLLDGIGGSPVVPGWVTFSCNASTEEITFAPTQTAANGIDSSGVVYPATGIVANTPMQVHSSGSLCGGLVVNTTYYLLTACAASANVACVTQVSLAASGAAVNLTGGCTGTCTLVDQGSSTMYIIAAPNANAQWIQVKSNGAFPPVGVRVLDIPDTEFFHIRQMTTVQNIFPGLASGILSSNWHFGPGVMFDTTTNTDYLTTTDPRPYCGIFQIYQDSANIIFDQIRVKGPGYPNRFGCSSAIFHDGEAVGIINSDLQGLDYWHPWTTGWAGSIAGGGTIARLGVGSAYSGASIFGTKTTLLNSDVTITGGAASGTAYWYLKMDGSMNVMLPNTITASISCSGVTCTTSNSASPTWPLDGNSRTAALKLATFTLTAGVVTAICTAATGCVDPFYSVNAAEGSQAIISGNGPGPYIFENNTIAGTGIPLHYDDSGGPFLPRCDYTVTHNFFDNPIAQLANGSASSNTLRYGNRQPLEWKGGCRIKTQGNFFRGSFSEVSPASLTVALTPRAGGSTTDFLAKSNWLKQVNGGLDIGGAIDSNHPVSKPTLRLEFANNLFELDGPTQVVSVNTTIGRGWAFFGGYAMEDPYFHNNTVWKPKGGIPAFSYWQVTPVSGVRMSNNVMARSTGTNDGFFARSESVSNCASNNYTFIQCAWVNGPGNPAYTFSNNALVTSWADAQNQTPTTSVSEATACTEGNGTFTSSCAGSIFTYFPTGASVNARWNLLQYVDPANGDFRLNPASPLISSGVNGVDFETLLDDLGVVRAITWTPGPTSIALTYRAPDTRACYVAISADAGVTWTYTSDGGSSTSRAPTVTGLTTSTAYVGRLLCYTNQSAAWGYSSDQITTHNFTTSAAGTGPAVVRGSIRGVLR